MIGVIVRQQHGVAARDAMLRIPAPIPAAIGITHLMHEVWASVDQQHLSQRTQQQCASSSTHIAWIFRPQLRISPRRIAMAGATAGD
jgi:hypothetical protein